ncbi:peptidoglycan editing factor PgeF [Caulobacter hibisci]|uniref:Purine nucleoside phosphorylase n=1 Tax=Caulobacter hibisci TaxID=2035993 RepID=A0ABS0SYS5_9CAUL|nr:peptidoglycan editing factor PgeF [Caulobacter hibisci]MBI1684591.1 peptidoglycan editing factor PgeF [Caulobacter hibisci]
MTQHPLPTVQSPLLAAVPGLRHAFFTRNGGVSKGLYDSLNVGRGSQDEPADVVENRARAAHWFGVEREDLNTCFQIHSTIAIVADGSWGDARPQGDAVVSKTPGVVCGALHADCAPVLIVDPEARVVAAAHAGWRGALDGVVQAAVDSMVELGADPARMVAAVGPCIGPDSYEVGLEFLHRFEADCPGSKRFFKPGRSGDKRMFDLPAFVLDRIETAGIERREWIGRDTCAEEAEFFSNRRAVLNGQKDYGRLLSAIMLEG